MLRRVLLLLAIWAGALSYPAAAATTAAEVQTTWRLLDYMAVDYSEAVRNGRVVNPAEYAEMIEFGRAVGERLNDLPPHAQKAALQRQTANLQKLVDQKVSPALVQQEARALGAALLAAYPVPLAPATVPEVARGAALYKEQCSSCHGATGDGRGPLAKGMDPPPVAFTDRTRAKERSVFGLYQVIDQGLEGTAMQSFAQLPADDRWALAFHVGRYAYPPVLVDEGRKLWESDGAVRARVPNLAALASITPAALARSIGDQPASAVIAYLRSDPSAVVQQKSGSLTLARQRLSECVAAYREGDARGATELALSAYLDGFEPVEPLLAARDAKLMGRIETAMGELRSRIGSRAPIAAVEEQVRTLDELFDRAEEKLNAADASSTATFLGAFAVLLREGLEALLVVIAMIAFLNKADRRDALPYVHGGWVAALFAGAATWFAATYLIEVSGASRELTEGFGSLFAAVVLLSVGVWMHGKSKGDAWQRYIREKLQHALSKRSAWFLFGLTFIVVYREVFETILFYATMWSQGGQGVIVAGGATAIFLLSVIAWAMLRFSRKLPIAKFFAYSSILIAVLAVILAGKGIAGLQEAGLIDVRPLAGIPRVEILGLFPSLQSVAAQLFVAAFILFSYAVLSRGKAGAHASH